MSLQHEIARKRPFDLPEQEAWLNLQRTASRLAEPFDRLFRDHGLSQATYNVLRILRGVHAEPQPQPEPDPNRGAGAQAGVGPTGLPSGEICRRMVSRGADVTRLVDRLAREGLVERHRDGEDRRVVHVAITPAGLERLAALDAPIRELHRSQLAAVPAADLAALNDLLVRVRQVAADAAASPERSDPA
jgi:DNA-binding MarR family transcriptional regulator